MSEHIGIILAIIFVVLFLLGKSSLKFFNDENLIKEYDIICIEDLYFKGFMKSNKAKSYQDVSQSEFVRQLEYKTKWHGKTISKISRFYPSTQLCSEYGYKNPALKDTSIRE